MWEWEAPEETGLTVTVGDALAVEDLVYPGTGQRSPGHRREDDAVPPRAQVPEVAAGKPAVQLNAVCVVPTPNGPSTRTSTCRTCPDMVAAPSTRGTSGAPRVQTLRRSRARSRGCDTKIDHSVETGCGRSVLVRGHIQSVTRRPHDVAKKAWPGEGRPSERVGRGHPRLPSGPAVGCLDPCPRSSAAKQPGPTSAPPRSSASRCSATTRRCISSSPRPRRTTPRASRSPPRWRRSPARSRPRRWARPGARLPAVGRREQRGTVGRRRHRPLLRGLTFLRDRRHTRGPRGRSTPAV